ncbi:MAG: UDP-N-acetylmuramoyl-tripeptide--D-alanyl-D-alanine ligase [Gammaproteobacteria bacterium]|jgi:UDP-N-acetylmuramoyl-tripeptide--D-alanyl-D-alanine ligase
MIQMRLSEAAGILNAGLYAEDLLFRGCSTDTRNPCEGALFIALHGENYDGHKFVDQAIQGGAVAAMVEREFNDPSLPMMIVQDTRRAMGELASAWRTKFTLPVIAVTGSAGKTTVKEMLASILSAHAPVLSTYGNFNNDIGVPLTLFGLHGQHKFAVIEMGANHPGEIANLAAMTKPSVAVITLCAPAHIEGFGSIDGVAEAKAEIFSGLRPEGVAIINVDDQYAASWQLKASGSKQLSFGMNSTADISGRNVELNLASGCSQFVMTTPDGEIDIKLNLLGLHNVRNALAAAACCVAIDIPLQQIKEGLQRMQAVKGRMQSRAGIKNSRIIDDTYNANPASLEAAIQAASITSARCWLVLGDMGELGDAAVSSHQQAGEIARAAGIERLYTLGELGEYAVQAFGTGARHYTDQATLIETLVSEMGEGLTVLVKGSRAMAMEHVVHSLVQGD